METFTYELEQPLSVLVPRLVAAVLLGAVLGFERERADKPAGLRTHMMVSLGSAAFTILGFSVHSTPEEESLGFDPSRIVQGIIGGLGFLGAGSIMKSRHPGEASVSGLTTAASVWLVGAIGVACGMGAYAAAVVTSVLALGILILSRWA
jgi:putative Mg2+ transporter-C (MgtC) family protein